MHSRPGWCKLFFCFHTAVLPQYIIGVHGSIQLVYSGLTLKALNHQNTAESAADHLHGRSRLRPRPLAERHVRMVREGKASRHTGTEMTRLRLTQHGRQPVIPQIPHHCGLCVWSVPQAGRFQGAGAKSWTLNPKTSKRKTQILDPKP